MQYNERNRLKSRVKAVSVMQKKIKVLFVLTEGWFFLSHFRPLAEAISSTTTHSGTIVTTLGNTRPSLEELQLETISLDFERASFNPFSALKLLWNLRKILRKERPDIVHFIALKPIIIGGLASLFLREVSKVYHLTGLGYLAKGKTWLAKTKKNIIFRMAAFFTRQNNSWLITENPDDLAFLQKYGATKTNTSLFGGAGVDPDYFTPAKTRKSDQVHIGYVGRMIWSKGVDVLVEAMNKLRERGISVQLNLFGTPDLANPKSISYETLERWSQLPNISWHGGINDVRKVWAKCEIAVVPTRIGEGMPRAMLEAAACARGLIVTDVAGCRHFVEPQKDGLLVPPEDATALADAIELLVANPRLRKTLGENARKKILENYTEAHVRSAILKVYEQVRVNGKNETGQ